MASKINASTSGAGGLISTADASGVLQLQSSGTTVATVNPTGFQVNTYLPASSLITSGTAVATTSGTSVTFTGIPAWVKKITVMFQAVSTSGTSPLLIRIGNGSIINTGYVSAFWTANITNGQSTTSFQVTGGAAAASSFVGNIVINNISGNSWVSSGVLGDSSASSNTSISGGSISLGGTLDRLAITTVNGTDTFDAGSINILYE